MTVKSQYNFERVNILENCGGNENIPDFVNLYLTGNHLHNVRKNSR